MSGQTIGRYEIERELGRGGMAIVYLARDTLIKRQVAVKVLPHQFTFDPQFSHRFRREAEIIAALEHAFIVPLYDFGEHDQQPFLVMQWMTGGSLAERLKSGPLPLAETAAIIRRIGAALDQAHAQGIIHRDLKPGNILFDQYGEAYLSDFGIARLAESRHTLTGTGGVVGTPAYMSPEQAVGEGDVDYRSDLYGLGVITYELLTGSLPYWADTPLKLMLKHVNEPVPSIQAVRPNLPPDAAGLIERALAKNPADRFGSAGELATALAALAEVGEANETTRRRGDAEENRGTTEPGGLTDGEATLLGATVASPLRSERPTPAIGSKKETLKISQTFRIWLGGGLLLAVGGVILSMLLLTGPNNPPPTPVVSELTPEAIAVVAATPTPTVSPTHSPVPTRLPTTPPPPTATSTPTHTPSPAPTLSPTFTATARPTYTSTPESLNLIFSQDMNIRGGPGINYPVVGQAQANQTAPLIGRNADSSWWQIEYATAPDDRGWVKASLVQVTSDTANLAVVEAPPPPSPVPTVVTGRIAFATRPDGNTNQWQLYTIKLDGSGLTKVGDTNNPYNDNFSWSPDGARIAFISSERIIDHIYVVNADGSGLTRLTPEWPPDMFNRHSPRWSPDGQRIAFEGHQPFKDENGLWQIYVINADGSDLTKLTDSSDRKDLDIWWSPDDQKISYRANAKIYVVNADGSSSPVEDNSAYTWQNDPFLSPDGKWLVGYGSSGLSLHKKGSPQMPTTLVTNVAVFDPFPSWTPDGKQIVFNACEDADNNRAPDPATCDLYVINTDGSGLTNLTNQPAEYRFTVSP